MSKIQKGNAYSIRVFVSSTFLDLKEEREYLMKHVFPQIEQRCQEHGVNWSVVDLRWGISEDIAQSGKTLETCLYEIEQCRPYFIGILGDRYGWIPERPLDELFDEHPWLQGKPDISITEIEIRHGALNYPPDEVYARFYFKAPDAEIGKDTTTGILEKEESQEKLRALKEEIKASGHQVQEGYNSLEMLGKWIVDDFQNIITENYPTLSEKDAFVQTRNDLRFYQKRILETYHERAQAESTVLDYLESETAKLLITGEAGTGKSAFMAALASELQVRKKANQCILYFSVASVNIISKPTDSLFRSEHELALKTSINHIFDFWINEITREFEIADTLIEADANKRQKFLNCLSVLNERNIATFLFLDGIDKLEIEGPDQGLFWLEQTNFEQVKWVISTQRPPTESYLRYHGYVHYTIDLFSQAEIQSFTNTYLKRFGKKLEASQLALIANSQQCRHPLFLKSILDELRVFGVREKINERLNTFLKAENLVELYDKIFSIWEADLEGFRPGLVANALSLIALSRSGLHEGELLGLLGDDREEDLLFNITDPQMRMDISYTTALNDPVSNHQLPLVFWASFYRRATNVLQSMASRVQFANSKVQEAVNQRYLNVPEQLRQQRLFIAEYFRLTKVGPRKIEEQPWQYLMAEDWESLKYCISSAGIFSAFMSYAPSELRMYWNAIGDRYDIGEAYETSTQLYLSLGPDSEFLGHFYRKLVRFFTEYYLRPDLSYKYSALLTELGGRDLPYNLARKEPEVLEVTDLLNQAINFIHWGELQEASAILQRIFRKMKNVFDQDHYLYAGVFRIYGDLLKKKGDTENALAYYESSLVIARKYPNRVNELMGSLYHTGDLLIKVGEEEKGVILLREAEALVTTNFGYSGKNYIAVLYALAQYEHDTGNYIKSYELYEKCLNLVEGAPETDKEIYEPILNGWAIVCRHMGRLEDAETLYKKALANPGGDFFNRISLFTNYGILLWSLGRLEEALEYLGEAFLGVTEKVGYDNDKAVEQLEHLVSLFHRMGRIEDALVLTEQYLEATKNSPQRHYNLLVMMRNLAEEAQDNRRLGIALVQQGVLLLYRSEHEDQAFEVFQQCAALSPPAIPSTYEAMGYEALMYNKRGQLSAYQENITKLNSIIEKPGTDEAVLEPVFYVLTRIHLELKNKQEANISFTGYREACQNLSDFKSLAGNTIELAGLAVSNGFSELAHHHLECSEHFLSEAQQDGLLYAMLGDHGHLYMQEGDYQKSLELHEKVYDWAVKSDDKQFQISSLQNKAIIYDVYIKDYKIAYALIEQAMKLAHLHAPESVENIDNSRKIIEEKLEG